jgi:WD40 repeat protein
MQSWHLSCAWGLFTVALAASAGPLPSSTPETAAPPGTAELLLTARERTKEDPQLGLLLLLEARARGATPESTAALREWLAQPGRAVLRGHEGVVLAVAFSSDGQRVATGGLDGTARLWDGLSGKPLAVLRGHEGPVRAVAFSEAGGLATGGDDGTVRLWAADTGRELEVLRGGSSPVMTVLFRPGPERSQLVSVALDGTALLWHARTGSPPVRLGDEDRVHSVAFDATGSRLLTTDLEGVTREWNPDSGGFVGEWFTHGMKLRSVAFSPDGSRIVGTSSRGQAFFLPSASDEQREREGSLERLGKKGEGRVKSATFSPDGSHVLTVDSAGTAKLWDLEHLRVEQELEDSPAVHTALFAPKGPYLLTLEWNGGARLWRIPFGTEPVRELQGTDEYVVDAAFSPDGSRLVTLGSKGPPRLWAVAAPLQEELKLEGHVDRTAHLEEVHFSPDGKQLLGRGGNFSARLWDATSGQELQEFRHRSQPVLSMAFDARGERIALLGPLDGKLLIWEAATGTLLRKEPLPLAPNLFTALFRDELRPGTGRVSFSPDGRRILTGFSDHDALLWTEQRGHSWRLAGTASALWASFSPDGRRVATGSLDGGVVLWDAVSGRELRRVPHAPGSKVRAFAFSPDASLLATAEDSPPAVRLWQVESGRELEPLRGFEAAQAVLAFSPEGTRLLCSGGDNRASLWEIRTAVPRTLELTPSSGEVTSAAFNPDGTLFFTVSSNGALLLWSATQATPLWQLADLRTSADPWRSALILNASFSPDGRRLLTASTDSMARVWACSLCAPAEELVTQARSLLGRELSCAERREYLREDVSCPPTREP